MLAGKIFYDHAVDLTGQIVSNCYFDGCVITVNASHPPVGFHEVTITHCLLLGDGWPPEVYEAADKE